MPCYKPLPTAPKACALSSKSASRSSRARDYNID
jgi:hypothetical protein